MITIPLGLGTRWPRRPWVTFAIAFVLVLVFFFDKGDERYMNVYMHELSTPQYRFVKTNLFAQWCNFQPRLYRLCRVVYPVVAVDYDFLEHRTHTLPGRPRSASTEKADAREFAQVAHALQRLEDTPGALELLEKFEKDLKARKPLIRKLYYFKQYRAMMAAADLRRGDSLREEHILTGSNIHPDSVFFAQIRHGGYGHLLGNLLCFLPFGIFVEMRLGALRYLLAYILTGTVGLLFNATYFLPPDLPLLGASANIAGIMGVFYVLFFHARMRFMLFFVWARVIWTPVKYTLPIVFFVADISGALESLLPGPTEGGVAHFAHLAGLATGMLLASIFTRLAPVARPFLYAEEPAQVKVLHSTPNLPARLLMARAMLAINPDNAPARGTALYSILSAPQSLLGPAAQEPAQFLIQNLDAYCAVAIKNNQAAEALRLVAAVPLQVPYVAALGTLGQPNYLLLADAALAAKLPFVALRLYDGYLMRWPTTAKAREMRMSAQEILNALPHSVEVKTALEGYVRIYADSPLAPLFKGRLSAMEGANHAQSRVG